MPFPELIETERLVLRRFREDDYDAMLAIWSDEGVWRGLGPERPFDESVPRHRFAVQLAHWRDQGFGRFLAIERNTRQVAGFVGPAHPDFVPELEHEVEVGWALRGCYRGRGLAAEGARAAIAASFEHLSIARVISLIRHSNTPSVALAKRLGMRPAGEVTHAETGESLRVYALERAD